MKTNTISLKSNRFFDEGAYIGNKSMVEIVKENILKDYQKTGVKNGSITIIPSDIYVTGQVEPKVSWADGQILKLGSVVRICDHNGNSVVKSQGGQETLFRVYSKEVSYSGEPLINLGLMQVK